MKRAIFASITLVLFSFGTTLLMYDFSVSQNDTKTKPTLKDQTSSPINIKSVVNAPAITSTSTLLDTTKTSTTTTVPSNLAIDTAVNTTNKTTVKPTIANTTSATLKNEPSASSTQTQIITPPIKAQTPPLQTSPTPSNNPISWGVFTGSNPTVIHEFEKRVSTNPDYLAYFIHWGNGEGALPAFLSDFAYKKDRTLVIFWEASDYKIGGTNQPAYSYQAMLDGNFDNYFKSFAQQLKRYKGPVILIPFSELNGNWTPWSGTKNGNTPELAVEAFRYVHGFFTDLDNVKIGWAVNSASVPDTPENQIQNYYPGDDYVDIVGVDGFNMNSPWLSFDEIFGKTLRLISQYNKPMFIFSFASAEGPNKAKWLDDALNIQMPKYPLLESWIYFNQNKERNWLVWSDDETFAVFLDYVSR